MSNALELPDRVDLLIVGAGPAGMAAAAEAAAAGLTVALADENADVGGQIYRQIATARDVDTPILGKDYFSGRALTQDLTASGALVLCDTSVWMIERSGEGFDVGLMQAGLAQTLSARAVLIATGALERPFPIPGWTLPGVMTAGAAQIMLKASRAVPGDDVVLAGTGPLLYLLAAQFARAKVRVQAVLDTTPRANWRAALPHLPGFLTSPYLAKGLSLLAEVRRSTRVVRGVTALAALGQDRLDAVGFTAKGRSEQLNTRLLLLHQGVVPQVNLGMAAGCQHVWNDARLAFEPVRSPIGESTVANLFIAGDSGGIAGATAAEAEGRLIAQAIVGRLGTNGAGRPATALRRNLAKAMRGRAFLDSFYRPAPGFRVPADDVIVCRCEEVTAGDIRKAVAGGAQGPNQTKALLRTGMGPCQGRLCGLTVSEIIAFARSKATDDIGHFGIRNPVKPITLGALASAKQHSTLDAPTAKRLF